MKKLILFSLFALLFAGANHLEAKNKPEEFLGLPGDNLNLYAVMNLFQESETLEGFERSLNDPKTMINNLDLNGDNYVDYILVLDYPDDKIHNIVLRVALNKNEFQDVAVFTVEKFRDGSVAIQLIGDEALYGPNYIIEPVYDETPNPGYTANVRKKSRYDRNVTVVRTTYYEVAQWPVIVYISRPTYRVYRSSWYWGYYPEYWSPWNPHYWHFYYGYHYNWHGHYYAHYRPWGHYRCGRYRTVYYTSVRNYSPVVVVNVNKGVYKNTYSRPEKRTDGERFYAQRVSEGTTIPGRSRPVDNGTVSRGARQAEERSDRAVRPTGDVRTAPENRGSRDAGQVRPSSSQSSGQSAGRESRGSEVRTAPVRSSRESSGPAVRSAAPQQREGRQNERSVRSESSGRERVAPSRPASEREDRQTSPAVRSSPSGNNREAARPAKVERSQPSRESAKRESSSVRSSGQTERSRSTEGRNAASKDNSRSTEKSEERSSRSQRR